MYRWKAFLTNTCISTYSTCAFQRILFVRHMVSRGHQRSGGHLSVGITVSEYWSHPCSYVVLSISCVWNTSCPTQPCHTNTAHCYKSDQLLFIKADVSLFWFWNTYCYTRQLLVSHLSVLLKRLTRSTLFCLFFQHPDMPSSGSTNGVSLGWDYRFVQPIANKH